MDNSLDLRSAIPMSDEEIKRIYADATKYLEDAYAAGAEERIKQRRVWWLLLSVPAIFLALYFDGPNLWAIVIFSLLLFGPMYGEFSSRLVRKLKRKLKLRNVDVRNPGVLRLVVDHVKLQPQLAAERIKARAEERRKALGESAIRLGQAIVKLDSRLAGSLDESVRLLMENKRTMALQTIKGLKDADAMLDRQLREADEIVKPVQEMAAQFELMWDVHADISAIQEARELVASSRSDVDERMIELACLSLAASEAMNKLEGLQLAVDSEAHARLEVDSWTNEAEAASKTVFPNS